MNKLVFLISVLISLLGNHVYALNGEYIISLENGKVLDADTRDLGKPFGCKVQIWDYVPNSANQKWILEERGNGAHVIKCAANNQYLTVGNPMNMPAQLSNSFDEKSQIWIILGIQNATTPQGEGYYIWASPDGLYNLMDIPVPSRQINGVPISTTVARNKPFPRTIAKWFLRKAEKTRVKLMLKGISLSNIHNDDCRKVWGNMRAELWYNRGDGSEPQKVEDPLMGEGVLFQWVKDGSKKPIANYATLTDYTTISNVNQSIIFSVNPSDLADRSRMSPDAQIRAGSYMVKIIFQLGAAHKSCDVCTDYSENAGIRGEQVHWIYVNSTWQAKQKRQFVVKDGPAVIGPHRSATVRDHHYRFHFDIQKLD